MLKEAIVAIAGMAVKAVKPQPIEIEGNQWTTAGLTRVPVEPDLPDTLNIGTLNGLVKYLLAGLDAFEKADVLVKVGGPTHVEVVGKPEGHRRARPTWADLRYEPVRQCHVWSVVGSLIPLIREEFHDTVDRDAVLSLLSRVEHTEGVSATDDGLAQTIVARSRTGSSLVEGETIPTSFTLHPRWTFPDVSDLVSATFGLRLEERNGQLCGRMLCENADEWSVGAMDQLEGWLEEKLPDHTVLA